MTSEVDFNISFVQEIKKYPEIYNYTLQNYSKKQEIKKAWNEISKKVKKSIPSCIKKWGFIQRNFNRSFETLSPSRFGREPKNTYYLAKHLEFLVPFLNPPNMKTKRIYNKSAKKSPHQVEGADTKEAESVDEYIEIMPVEAVSQEQITSKTLDNQKKKVSSSQFQTPQRKRPAENIVENNYTDWANFMQENPDLSFCKSLLPDIAKLDDSKKLKFKLTMLSTLNGLLHE